MLELSMCQWTIKSNCLSLCSVYADGSICLDILQNRWSPTYDVSSILTSIQVHVHFFLSAFLHRLNVLINEMFFATFLFAILMVP